jgi:hypothetical protein
MYAYRNLKVLVALVLGAAALTVSGTAASSASTVPPGTPASPRQTATAAPDPNAPHLGTVAGRQTGPHISVNNPTSLRAFRQLHQQMLDKGSGTRSDPTTIHEYVGTSFKKFDNSTGSQATQSVSRKIKPANGGTTLYTPTMYPSGGSCVEVSTAYFFTSQVVAAWDWCVAIRFVVQVTIDRSFIRTYTLDRNYAVQIEQTDPSTNEWTSYLYNYRTGQWETLFKQSGTSQVGLAEGWDLYELYSNLKPNGQSYACIDLRGKRIESQDIQVKVGSTWEIADPSNAGDDYDVPLGDFHCKSLSYQMITQYSHWKAIG